ncbi:MAG: PHP domain-containing protein [bacterium]
MRVDFHIHTEYLGCADETMTLESIADRCQELGVDEIAITDHLNQRDEVELHRKIKKDIMGLDHDLTIYFGAELNFDGEFGQFAADEKVKEEEGFQFFIGGIHSAYGTDRKPREILETQHQHHLETCKNDLVKVLVHPYWFNKSELEEMPWLTDLSLLPEEWIKELADTAINTDTAIEINYEAIFGNPSYKESFKDSYKEYLTKLRDYGVTFSISTDAHNIDHLNDIIPAHEILEELAIPKAQMWNPEVPDIRNIKGGKK